MKTLTYILGITLILVGVIGCGSSKTESNLNDAKANKKVSSDLPNDPSAEDQQPAEDQSKKETSTRVVTVGPRS